MRQKLAILACLLALTAVPAAHAVITFTQLGTDTFVVSHRVKGIGSRGQAMRLVFTKAASLCVAAGYSHLEILEQESQASQEHESANATIRVRLFRADGDGRLDCERGARPDYVEQAREKLAAKGYKPPPSDTASAPAKSEGTPAGACTIEQIVAMVHAGLGVEQIKAACVGPVEPAAPEPGR